MPERRLESRLLCADMVETEWTDRSGARRNAPALLEDISTLGLCLQMESPVPVHTNIEVAHARGTLTGEVCFCEYREIGYFVGVRFEQEHRWSTQQFLPKHLIDLSELAASLRPE